MSSISSGIYENNMVLYAIFFCEHLLYEWRTGGQQLRVDSRWFCRVRLILMLMMPQNKV